MKPHEYRWIKAWSSYLGSMSFYIIGQQELASAENAPVNAVYKLGDGTGWRTVDDLPEFLSARLKLIVERDGGVQ